jgi:hypothetical protein
MSAHPHLCCVLSATLAFTLSCSGGPGLRAGNQHDTPASDAAPESAPAALGAPASPPASESDSGSGDAENRAPGASPDAARDGDLDATMATDAGLDTNASAATADGEASTPSFDGGVFYRQPNLSDPSALLTRVAPPVGSTVTMSPVGFDVRGSVLVFPYPGGLVVVDPSLQPRRVPTPGLYGAVRPSLSPDGRRAVVQASETPEMPPTNLDIFVVSLDDGTSRKISNLPYNEESPRWFPASNRIAYTSFSPTEGVNLHVYDLDLARETLFAKESGALQIAISPDEKSILDFWRLRMYDSTSGAIVADLRASLETALSSTGYAADTAHPGMGGRMTFVLDGSFSPDGTSLVLDGAVTRGGASGSVLFTTPIGQPALTPVTALVELNYAFSNQNNFSQLNPIWR